jgi:NADPH2:quinone reductase
MRIMHAAVIQSFDAPPRYSTFEDPVAGEGETLVNVSAAGLHPIVRALANGSHYGASGQLPAIAGIDGVGYLEDGSRVFFGRTRPTLGTFAERSITMRAMCLAVPDELDDATAAAMPNPGMSSWAALTFRARFVAGESILILGATGVAGRLAVQIAKRLGARRVIAAGRNPRALEALPGLGADAVISLDQNHDEVAAAFRAEWAKDKIDIVLDYLWGAPAEAVFDAISQKGLTHAAARIRYVQVGNSAAPAITLRAETLRSSGLELIGSGFGSASLEEILRAAGEFLQEAARRPFDFKVKTAPLRDVESLWNARESGERIVFTLR